MTAGIGLEQIDSILDQLERLSHQEQSRRRFYDAVVSRLRMLLNAQSVSYLVRLGQESWSCVSYSGAKTEHSTKHITLVNYTHNGSWVLDADHCGLVVPIDPAVSTQAIVVRFESAIDELACKDLAGLIQAFAELIDERNRRELCRFFQVGFSNLQKSLAGLVQSREVNEAATVLVNDIINIMAADRVSLVECHERRTRILAVSGRTSSILPTEATHSIEQVCQQAHQSGKPQIRTSGLDRAHQTESKMLLSDYVACSLGLIEPSLHSNHGSSEDHYAPYILIEWSGTEEFVTGLSLIQYTLPTIAPLWIAHIHRLEQAKWKRWLGIDRLLPRNRPIRKWIKATALLIGIVAAYFGLTHPVEFRLELEGTLEPAVQRTIFASHDGYVEHLAVDDNSTVEKGQLVAAMRSPQLDLDIQDVRGELLANQEKHSALSISLNQFGSDTTDSQAKQQSLGSELKQIEIQRATLESRLEALENERQKLNLTSPIDGVVVSREITRTLDSRPIRRGDAVMRVADQNGNWRLALKVKDTDAGYLRQAYWKQKREGSDLHSPANNEHQSQANDEVNNEANSEYKLPKVRQLPIDFVIVSQPDRSFKANLNWISSSARNPDGQGVILDAFADIDSQAVSQAHIGATVQAYVRCGFRPFWYVWSRPLWEAIQRKLWF